MHTRKWFLFLLSVLLPLALLAGCGHDLFSTTAAAAAIAAQGRNVEIRFDTSAELDDVLRKAVQSGGSLTEIRLAILQELGLEDAAFFSESGLPSAREGQHAVQVYKVTGGAASHAASQVAKELEQAIRRLASGGEYDGAIAMIEKDGVYYIVVDVEVLKAGRPSGGGSSAQQPEAGEDDEDGEDMGTLDATITIPVITTPPEDITNYKPITVYCSDINSLKFVGEEFGKVNNASIINALADKNLQSALQTSPKREGTEAMFSLYGDDPGEFGNALAQIVQENQGKVSTEALLDKLHSKVMNGKSYERVALSALENSVKNSRNLTDNYYAYILCTVTQSRDNPNADTTAATDMNKQMLAAIKEADLPEGEEKFFIPPEGANLRLLSRVYYGSVNVGFVRIDDGVSNYTYVAVLQIEGKGINNFEAFVDDVTYNYDEIEEKLKNQAT